MRQDAGNLPFTRKIDQGFMERQWTQSERRMDSGPVLSI